MKLQLKPLSFKLLGDLRILVLGIGVLPLAVLPVLGVVWLWQHGLALLWVALMFSFALLGFGLNRWLDRRAHIDLDLELSGPADHWPPSDSAAWSQVEALSDRLDPQDWPLGEGGRLFRLGRDAVELVAREYHPNTRQPLLELSVPHLLRIIELAARDIGREVREQIPLSDRLTIGRLIEMQRWLAYAQDLFGLWRAGRLVVNPVSALLSEASEHFRGQAFRAVKGDVHRWLLQEYVRRTGAYAIEVYSGRLIFSDDDPVRQRTSGGEAANDRADERAEEPLRVLVLGQNNAGKSSLVNALFGELRAVVDEVSGTRALAAYALEREGLARALVIDSPGLLDLAAEDLLEAAGEADFILWVSAAHRADRDADRQALDGIRGYFAQRPQVHMPPVLVAVSHIDRLSPSREWEPPYDLRDDSSRKVRSIAGAVAVVAQELDLPLEDIVPVCLAEGHYYNVDDVLWAAILDRQGAAGRARSLRCLDSARRGERSALSWQQFRNAGRVLTRLPGRLL